MIYEYIRIIYDGSLEELCSLASTGWKLVTSCTCRAMTGRDETHFILEREIRWNDISIVQNYYKEKKTK
jgi:hypothetical protein